MKSKEEFRERFGNGEFNEELKNINSEEELVEFARGLGYEITVEDVLNTKLNKEEMAMIAGGKHDTYVQDNSQKTVENTEIKGDNNIQLIFKKS